MFPVMLFWYDEFVIASREEPIHVSRHTSVLMLCGMLIRALETFSKHRESRIAASFEVRGGSSSMRRLGEIVRL